jgi:glycosyltransferase involved in cell wall biosynthesis
MKITYIANARIPTEKAHGLQIMKMGESFGLAGNKVELVLPTRKNPDFKNVDPFAYYKIAKNFKIRKIKTIDPRWLLEFPPGTYIKFQSAFYIIGLFFFLLLRKNEDTIFYTRDEQLLPLLLLFSKNVIWEGHNLPSKKEFYLKFWQKCLKIVVITKGLKEKLKELGIVEDKILVAPDGVDFNKFSNISDSTEKVRKKLNLPLDKKLIIYTGHLYSWKGVQVLAEASKFLNQDRLVVFVGGTDKDIFDFQEKNKNFKNILVAGNKPYDQIPYYLKAADVLVLPNSAKKDISRLYTSPMKLFEYMASKKPIVATDLPSIREILDSHNAVIAKPDDPKDLAEKINKTLTNKELSDKISKEAYEAAKNYTWEKRARNIINFMNLK